MKDMLSLEHPTSTIPLTLTKNSSAIMGKESFQEKRSENGSLGRTPYEMKKRNSLQPCLINLNEAILHPLLPGVTMVGSGVGCPVPPDIILNGHGIAPQHFFIERLDGDDVILHPISELTVVDKIPVKASKPFPLVAGNVISIGEDFSFRFDGSELKESRAYERERIYEESPYATINSPPSYRAGNLPRTAGEVNKNSFWTMDRMDSPLTTIDKDRSCIRDLSERRRESEEKKFRDGYESDNFVSKVARFEFFAHNQQPKRNVNPNVQVSLPHLHPFKTCEESRNGKNFNGLLKSESSGHIGLHHTKILEYHIKYPSTKCEGLPRNPQFKKFSPEEGFLPFRRSASSTGVVPYYNDESLSSSPSSCDLHPDEMSPISLNHSLYRPHSRESEMRRENPGYAYAYKESPIACEALLKMKRNQAEEARRAAQVTEKSEKLRLEEILAMCAEYEEQIAEEIKEKRLFIQSQKEIASNNNFIKNKELIYERKNGFMDIYHNRIKTNGSLPREKKSSSSSTYPGVDYSPKSLGSQNGSIGPNGTDDEISSIFTYSPSSEQEMKAKSYSKTYEPFQNVQYLKRMGNGVNGNDDIDRMIGSRHRKSPYENMVSGMSHQNEVCRQFSNGYTDREPSVQKLPSPRSRIKTTLKNGTDGSANGWKKVDSPRRPIITTVLEPTKSNNTSGSSCNGPNASNERIVQTGEETPSSSKSKLSVSFSSSIEEYETDVVDTRTPFILPLERVKHEDPTRQISAKIESNESCRSVVKTIIATEVQVHVEDSPHEIESESNDRKSEAEKIMGERSVSFKENEPKRTAETLKKETQSQLRINQSLPTTSTEPSPKSFMRLIDGRGRVSALKKELKEVEQQEIEALREMDIEKALLDGEENSLQRQVNSDKQETEEVKKKLDQFDENCSQWRKESLERITELKTRLMSSENEVQKLEKLHEDFQGTTDEETLLLERLKFQHENVEIERKAFEDFEYMMMEEEASKQTQRDDLAKVLEQITKKSLLGQQLLNELKIQNESSLKSTQDEIVNLERSRQVLILELEQDRESKAFSDTLSIQDQNDAFSDTDDIKNIDLDEKMKALSIINPSTEDTMSIERIKSKSPIEPTMGKVGEKTFPSREIEKPQEVVLSNEGVTMLEAETARVKQLQKRVQDAVREEWENSRKNGRSNQCHSLNSVGSDDSNQTISDTPTDQESGSSDDATDKSTAPTLSTTDVSLIVGGSGQNSFEICQQTFLRMRQNQREMSESFEEPRPLSDGSAYDGSSIVTLRDKQRIQNRPLTRYLPVRGDEDHFDLRAHIESSGHQLELCPQVLVTTSAARGFLSKLGSRFHNWNKRWFVFDRDSRTLSYYIDKNEKKPRGGIHFQAIEEVYVDHLQSVKSPNQKLTFCVKTYNRVFHFVAPSAEAMRIWVDIIFTGAEGYQEFKCGT